MTTPLPLTPGDVREDHAQATADTVAAIYGQAELALIATVADLARKTAMGALLPAAAQARLRHTANSVFSTAAPRIRAAVQDGFVGADIRPLATLLDRAAATSAAALHDTLAAATQATGQAEPARPAGNIFAQIADRAIASTRGAPLSLSRIHAAQKALDDLGAQGITGFTDRAGRRWDLTSYVEMATRTAVSNAWDDMQAKAMLRSGVDLVLVATHSQEGSCRKCLPWLGRTLSLTGASVDHPSLSDAKAAGFRHPSCRCYWTPLGAPAAVVVPSPADLARSAKAYEVSQRQRALERQLRAAGRRAHAAITPAARAAARRDLGEARAASAAHRRQAGHLRRAR